MFHSDANDVTKAQLSIGGCPISLRNAYLQDTVVLVLITFGPSNGNIDSVGFGLLGSFQGI